ncbi:2-methoxy-6-polyprenyl-14-benzoquinol methylase mitochondrial [Zea mays]|uniref:2-methoxy-6-polyprenyl-14-benzoquinol methylase mitochondrial n=1 Tax=Zea mays TaxID=4577 RepID=A0A1D6KGH1_MAIZE|nr:2-methoxy-6-polyprenyl-14-benzoquinol methylase mitochondrial [Zea mays]
MELLRTGKKKLPAADVVDKGALPWGPCSRDGVVLHPREPRGKNGAVAGWPWNGKCAYMLLVAVRLASSKLWDLFFVFITTPPWRARGGVESATTADMTLPSSCSLLRLISMLEFLKCSALGYSKEHCLSWIQGDAEALSFEDGSMDGYTIAFGIRNVTHIEKALSEAYSYDAYSFSMIPAIGELVDGDRQIEDGQHANQACEP